MRQIPVMILAALLLNHGGLYSQQTNADTTRYYQFATRFMRDFNDTDYPSMVAVSSSKFLQSIKQQRFIDFISGIRKDFGKVTAFKFKYFDRLHSAVFHTELEKTWFNFYIGLDDSDHLSRLVVLNPNYNEDLPASRNKTRMSWPFDTTTHIFWGGDTEDDNYHVGNRAQKNAFDIVIRNDKGKTFRTDGKSNEDYYAYGKKIYSPCDGTVITAINNVPENIPGKMDPLHLTGNTVIIRTKKGEYVLLAHMVIGSVKVKEGDKIKAGQWIGLCGNSGNSSEPHLHLHMMDKPTMEGATGIKCYFSKLLVNGQKKEDYSPVKAEVIQPMLKP
jgi:hypothetical protein